jgi:hypothetical protein
MFWVLASMLSVAMLAGLIGIVHTLERIAVPDTAAPARTRDDLRHNSRPDGSE